MISFKNYGADAGELLRELALLGADIDYADEVISSFSSYEDDDVEVAFSFAGGCLLVRIFDMGRYSFVYPIALSEEADESAALLLLRDYAVREEIPLTVTDIPVECLGDALSHFRHATVDAEDIDRTSYRMSVHSELSLIDELPTVSCGGISLSPLTEEDASSYARLCRDENVNKYWGYDYREDAGVDVCDGYFVSEAHSEMARGVALTLAARVGETFVGDAVIYAFDNSGSAEIGFRLLPEWQGRGFGRALLSATVDYAEQIGLISITARVMSENVRSARLLSSEFGTAEEKDGRYTFRKDI